MATSGKFSGPALTLAQRRYTAMKLRQQGFDMYQLAEEMKVRFPELQGTDGSPGYDALAAWNDINQMLANFRSELTESIPDVILLESQRLDEMTLALWPKVAAGRERAIELVLRIQERRAKMLGLDAATQVDWKVEIATLYENGTITLEDVRANLGDELFGVFTRFIEERKAAARASGDPLMGLKKPVASSGDESLALFTREVVPEFDSYISDAKPTQPLFEGGM